MSDTLLDMEPSQDSSIDDWKTWSLRLKARILTDSEKHTKAKESVQRIKADLLQKESAFRYQKQRIEELEHQIEQIKANRTYIFAKRIRYAISFAKRAVPKWGRRA